MSKDIKYTASVDARPFTAGMQRVADSLNGVQQRFGGTGREWGNVATAMSGHMSKVADSVRDSVSSMGGHFTGLLSSLGATRTGLLGLVAAGTALAASKVVEATAKQTEAAMDLARVMGTSTNTAQQWRLALEDVGASQGDLEGAAKGMSRQLKENEADMQAMGLKTRDAAGDLRPMNDLLSDGLKVLKGYKEGADRALASQHIFGRGVDASSKLLLVNNDTLADAKKVMEELGLEVGANAVAAWKEYDAATDRAGFSVKGLATTVGKILMPVLSDVINVCNAVMPTAILVVKGAIGGLATAFHGLKNGVVVVWEVINAMVVSVAEPIRAIGEAIGRAIMGDFAGAAAAVRNIGTVISSAWGGAMDRIAESSQRTRDRIGAIWGGDTAAGEPEGTRGSKTFKAPPGKSDKAGVPAQSRMAEWEAELAERKLNLAELANAESSFRELSKAEEAAYWKTILDRTDLSEKERSAVRRKYATTALDVRKEAFAAELEMLKTERDEAEKNFTERTRIAVEAHRKIAAAYGEESKEAKKAYADVLAEHRKFIEQQRQLDTLAADGRRNLAAAAVDLDRIALQEQQALGTVSRQEVLAAERDFEDRLNALRAQALQERLALIDPQRDPVAYAQVNDQIQQLELQHQQRLAQITAQMRQDALAPITGTLNEVQGAWGNLLAQMAKGTLTIGGFIRSIFKSVSDAVINTLSKMAAEWMVKQIAMRIFGKVDALSAVTREAGKAGAGGTASMAAAPFPLNLGAPAFGAAMSAAAMAFAPLATAARGFDIPAGLNPMTQLHAREMVLPAPYADVIRGLAGSGTAASQQVDNSVSVTNNFAIVGPVDRRTQDQIAQAAYEGSMLAQQRNG